MMRGDHELKNYKALEWTLKLLKKNHLSRAMEIWRNLDDQQYPQYEFIHEGFIEMALIQKRREFEDNWLLIGSYLDDQLD